MRRKDESLQQFSELSKKHPKGIPMKAMEKYLFDTISNRNVQRCLTQDDYNILQEKYGLLKNRNEKIEENAQFVMNKLAATKPIDSFLLFSEVYTIIIIGTSDLDKLNSNFTDTVIKKLIHSAYQFYIRYVYAPIQKDA